MSGATKKCKLVSEVKSKAKTLQHFKVESAWKIEKMWTEPTEFGHLFRSRYHFTTSGFIFKEVIGKTLIQTWTLDKKCRELL